MPASTAEFLAHSAFAVVGASNQRHKYGARVFECYLQHGRTAYPVNPGEETVQGHPCFPNLLDLPEPVKAASIITPPAVTERVVEDAIEAGLEMLWMQPGAESSAAVERAEEAGLQVIHGGPCLLVVLGYHSEH
jgi:predicted CoA-binding protein